VTVIFATRAADELVTFTCLDHDVWFKADQVKFDEKSRVVRIPCGFGVPRRFWFWTGSRPPAKYPLILEFRGVQSLQISSQTPIGFLLDITYDDQSGTITVQSGQPIKLSMVVDEVDAALYRDSA
jgi:hypothetical protein